MISTPEITERERTNKEIARHLAAEGIVLLENNGVLPLPEKLDKLALYGNGARRTVKGGTGSGDVNVREYTSIEQGLIRAGFHITSTAWLDEEEKFSQTAREQYENGIQRIAEEKGPQAALLASMGSPFQEPAFRELMEEELDQSITDTAVYVLSRNSGEGADRKLEAGDYFLTEAELHDIRLLAEKFVHFILLLNVGGVIDMRSIKAVPGIDAVVNISQGGSAFGDAVADVLTGKVTPSGKLTATWAQRYEDYPCAGSFAGQDQDDSWYEEGIYVGYRYFDSFHVEPAYEFGYGLSYTEFRITAKQVRLNHEMVEIEAEVCNVGETYAGKEVLQLYCTAPDGVLDQPYQQLCAFWKTDCLAPGESRTGVLTFPFTQLASYQESTASYILEKGDYVLRLGNSSKHTHVAAVLTLPQTVVTQQCRNLFGKEKISLLTCENRWESRKEPEISQVPYLVVPAGMIQKIVHEYPGNRPLLESTSSLKNATLEDVREGRVSLKELVSQLSTEELAELCVGGARMNMQDFSVIGNAADTIPGAAGETTKRLWEKRKIPSLAMADGPAGLRVNPEYYVKDGVLLKDLAKDHIFKNILPREALKMDLTGAKVYYQYCTAIPTAVMLAQSWNKDVWRTAGDLAGGEMEEMGIDLWLAPGMNLQRNPLGGRNFEYYSEDPLLSGICAAEVTLGVSSHPGRGTTIKHIAANNQETNRNYNNSHVTERTLRELYLKPFEICIKRAQPYAAMTSVNLVNGIHAANHYDILSAAMRGEWGFTGMVMTDWGTTSDFGADTGTHKYQCSSSAACITAGNDLIMPGSQADFDRLLAAVKSAELGIADLQWCAQNILRVILRSGRDRLCS